MVDFTERTAEASSSSSSFIVHLSFLICVEVNGFEERPAIHSFAIELPRACLPVDKLLGEILRTQGSESGHTERWSGTCCRSFCDDIFFVRGKKRAWRVGLVPPS